MFSEIPIEQNFGRPGRGIAGWLANDAGLLFYENYDIWRLDLSGQKAPVNLTNGYGRIHQLAFSIIDGQFNHQPIPDNQKIILATFNLVSKQNGFYSLGLDKANEPQFLNMGNYFYGAPTMVSVDGVSTIPVKAKNAGVYLVQRMSAGEAPNYFSTRDFKTFRILSNVNPERGYKWYSTELHSWTTLNGKKLQGILYKPEDFDSHKRYPIIFGYYERKSNNLNVYIKPNTLCQGCEIDIPTYVSNGYLVFTPDIVSNIGDPMQGTYDAVVSAAKYIAGLPFVDGTKMGIQGCSWGGFQTNYLVTHTNLFAAACSASGIADWIGDYGRLFSNGYPKQGMYEFGQCRMGQSIWEIPGAYIKSSPIFQLDKVTTPFLIMHTKKDEVCSFDDAIELFTGLRRLGKKSWMLAYPDADHGVYGKQAQDFSFRMAQFFDHYLKDKPAPIWMTRGFRASRRGLDTGLELDSIIKTPDLGLLTPEEQMNVDSLMTRKPITVTLK
ncbi:alpha/beta hydrolase family protein [Pedobacter panaciterrae]